MSSYTKLLLAVTLAFLAVLGAGFWLQNRAAALRRLAGTRAALRQQLTVSRTYPALIAGCTTQLEASESEVRSVTGRFLKQDSDSPRLIKAVVKSASDAGLEMVNASKLERSLSPLPAGIQARKVGVIAHELTLKGSYTGLVRFMQNLAAWEIACRLEGLAIEPLNDNPSSGIIEVTTVLSVFSLEPLDAGLQK